MNEHEETTNFVSRRGREESSEISQIPTEPSRVKSEQPNRKPVWRWRYAFILLVLVLTVFAVPFLVGEYLRSDYEASAKNAKQEVEQLVREVVLPSQAQAEIGAENIQAVASRLHVIRDGMCKGAFFDNMAGLYPRSKSALGNCQAVRSDIAALARGVDGLAAQAAYLEKLHPILQRLSPSGEEQFAVFSAQHDNWKTAIDQLKKLNVPTALVDLHSKLIDKSSEISGLWNTLSIATSEQSTDSFIDTEKKLSIAYEGFRALEGEYAKQLIATQDDTINAYKKL